MCKEQSADPPGTKDPLSGFAVGWLKARHEG